MTGMARLPAVMVWTVQVLCNNFNSPKLWPLRRTRSWRGQPSDPHVSQIIDSHHHTCRCCELLRTKGLYQMLDGENLHIPVPFWGLLYATPVLTCCSPLTG